MNRLPPDPVPAAGRLADGIASSVDSNRFPVDIVAPPASQVHETGNLSSTACALCNASPLPSFVFNLNEQLWILNQQLAVLLGASSRRAAKGDVACFPLAKTLQAALEEVVAAAVGKLTSPLMVNVVRNGLQREEWFEVALTPIHDCGRVDGVLGTMSLVPAPGREVSMEREAYAELSRSRSHLELALQAANCGACEWDLTTNQLTWSAEHFRIFGYEPFAFSPQYEHWWDRLHPEDRALIMRELDSARMHRRALTMEHRIVLPSGEIRWVASHGRFQFAADGSAISLHGIVVDISQRREAERALRESEERFRNLFEQASDGIFVLNGSGAFVMWNSAAARMLGRDWHELKSMTLYDTYVPEDAPLATERIQRACNGETLRFERRMLRKDGCIIDVESSVRRLPDGLLLGIIRDISERKRTGRALQESEERLRLATQTGKIGIWDWNIVGNRVSWTGSLYGIHGVTTDQFDGSLESFAKLIHPADLARVQACINRALESDAPYELEFRALRPDGEIIWLFTNAVVMREPAGRPVRMLGATVDITQMKVVEGALRASEERFQKLARHAPVGIFETDANGRCEFVNETWLRLAGMTAEQAEGLGWIQALHPSDRERIACEWDDAVQRRKPFQSEYRFQRPDGSVVWLSGHARAMRDEQGRTLGYIGTIADITERKAAERELEQRVAERTASLREAVAQMEEFSYSVSHDLRAPLRAIKGYAEALDADYRQGLDKQGREFLDRIIRNGTRMERLIVDILTYSRLSRRDIQLQAVSLDKLVSELVQQFPVLKGPHPEITICSPLGSVMAHEPSLSQAISNVLSNAAKFVAPGVQPRIRVFSETRGMQVRLWVEDNGIGIKAEQQGRLFGMFERIHPESKYEGTGIGLAIVRKAMERMGGTVGFESDGTNGTQFWIQLPRAI